MEKDRFSSAALFAKILGIYYIGYAIFFALRSVYSILTLKKDLISGFEFSIQTLEPVLKIIYKTGQTAEISLYITTFLMGFALYACSFIFSAIINIINEAKIKT